LKQQKCLKFEKKAIQKPKVWKKQAQKTSKFKLKQAHQQATRKSSKNPATPQKISPNSRENRKVSNTDYTTDRFVGVMAQKADKMLLK